MPGIPVVARSLSQCFGRHVFQSDVREKTRMRGPQLSNSGESVSIDLTRIEQSFDRRQQISIRDNDTGIDPSDATRICWPYLHFNAGRRFISRKYPLHSGTHQNVAAHLFESHPYLVAKNLRTTPRI